MTLTISNGCVARLDGTSQAPQWTFAPRNIAIQDGRIIEIKASGVPRGGEHIDARSCVVLPAFVNAHTHGFEWPFKGMKDGRGLDEPHPKWFWDIYENVPMELLRMGFRIHLAECIQGGVAFVGEVLRSDALAQPFAEVLEDVGVNGIVFSAQGEECGYDLGFESVVALPRRLQEAERSAESRPLHIHFLETERRRRVAIEHFGCTTGWLLEKRGLLAHPLFATHCGFATMEDLRPLAGRSTLLVSTPIAERRLENPHLDIWSAQKLGLAYAFGTDGPCYNPLTDMFAEMRAMYSMLSVPRVGDSAGKLLYAATLSARPWFGESSKGIAVGESADLMILSLDRFALRPVRSTLFENLLSLIVGAATASDVRATIVRGRILMLDHVVRMPCIDQLSAAVAGEFDEFLCSLGCRRNHAAVV